MIRRILSNIKITKEAICRSCFVLSMLLFVLSLLLQITITNKYSIKGSEMVGLDNKKDELVREISALNLEISEYASLTNIEKRAVKLGFVEYSSQISVIGSSKLASAR